MAQLMPVPLTVSCFSEIQIGFTFLVPDHLGSPGKGPLNGCVCVMCYVNFFTTRMSEKCIDHKVQAVILGGRSWEMWNKEDSYM